MNQRQANRVLTALYHFRNLPDEMVDLSSWNNCDESERSVEQDERMREERLRDQIPECGTTACFAGWMPFIFPEHWEHRFDDTPRLKNGGGGRWSIEADIAQFLGTDPEITSDVVADLVSGCRTVVVERGRDVKAPWLPECETVETEETEEPTDREKIIEWLEAELDRNGYETA